MTAELVGELRRRIYGWSGDAIIRSGSIETFWQAKGGVIALQKVLEFIQTTEDELIHPPAATEADEQE